MHICLRGVAAFMLHWFRYVGGTLSAALVELQLQKRASLFLWPGYSMH